MFLCQRLETGRECQPHYCKRCCVCVSVVDLANLTNFSTFCICTKVSGDVQCALCIVHCASWTQCTFADSLFERLDPRQDLRRKGESRSETWDFVLVGTLYQRWRGQSGALSVQTFLEVNQNTLHCYGPCKRCTVLHTSEQL